MHFIQKSNPWNLLLPHKGETLKLQLLKKLSLEIFETCDLSSSNGKPKWLFYDYSCHFFFLQPIVERYCVALRAVFIVTNHLYLIDSHPHWLQSDPKLAYQVEFDPNVHQYSLENMLRKNN